MLLPVLVCLLGSASAYQSYTSELPNGGQVPNPCVPGGDKWIGVGHKATLGGGARNVFGAEFAKHRSWTPSLCRMDSDGDGKSNGEELGDSDCVWKKGSRPSGTSNLGHPGICEPVDSARCTTVNSWLNCPKAAAKYECPAIVRDKAKYVDLRMPAMQLPARETNYYCMKFKIPADKDYQFIAMEPLIDNADLYHHAIVYACSDPEENLAADEMYSEPEECGMAGGEPAVCTGMIQAWGVGTPGWCAFDAVGIPFGSSYYNTVVMEVHWNNPQKRAGLVDTSGLRLFYIPHSRENNMQILMLSQDMLMLPPGKPDVTAVAEWLGECSDATLEKDTTYYLTHAGSHMHLLGSYSKLVLTRKSGKKEVLIDAMYDYNTPNFWVPEEPLAIYPGDELTHTCHFNTTKRTEYTFAGMGTSEEMCMVFMGIYPPQLDDDGNPMLANYLYSVADIGFCEMEHNNLVRGCNWLTLTEPALRKVAAGCEATEFPPRSCPESCRNALINTKMMGNPCLLPPMVFGVFVYEVLPGDPAAHMYAAVVELCQCRENRKCVEMTKERHLGDRHYNGIDPPVSTGPQIPAWLAQLQAILSMLMTNQQR